MTRAHRRPASLAELTVRLTSLRARTTGLLWRARLGAALRDALNAAGSPTWRPAEDLAWRRWIERHGDEHARELLAAVDAALAARAAAFAAKEPEQER